jgi:hypothetical protein
LRHNARFASGVQFINWRKSTICEHKERPHFARGACRTCYQKSYREGNLDKDFPLEVKKTRKDYWLEYQDAKAVGLSDKQILDELGISLEKLASVIQYGKSQRKYSSQ